MLSEISKEEVINELRAELGLPLGQLDEVLFAALIRREAGNKCPCTAKSIISSLCDALSFIDNEPEKLESTLSTVIDKLILMGDLVELADVLIESASYKSTTLFAGYPSFIMRPNNIVFLSGIVPDENSAVEALADRISYEAYRRTIVQMEGENLRAILLAHGLYEKDEHIWLKRPKKVGARDFLKMMDRKLDVAGSSSSIEGLLIFDQPTGDCHYNARWKQTTTRLQGRYVSKRPAGVGYIWCYSEFADGVFKKLIDLPACINGIIQRPCDTGWLLGMAIDACRGEPQKFAITAIDANDFIIEFYAPIPLWAEKNLIAIGKKIKRNSCLLAYELPAKEITQLEFFFQEYLWLVKLNK